MTGAADVRRVDDDRVRPSIGSVTVTRSTVARPSPARDLRAKCQQFMSIGDHRRPVHGGETGHGVDGLGERLLPYVIR